MRFLWYEILQEANGGKRSFRSLSTAFSVAARSGGVFGKLLVSVAFHRFKYALAIFIHMPNAIGHGANEPVKQINTQIFIFISIPRHSPCVFEWINVRGSATVSSRICFYLHFHQFEWKNFLRVKEQKRQSEWEKSPPIAATMTTSIIQFSFISIFHNSIQYAFVYKTYTYANLHNIKRRKNVFFFIDFV